jgi:hypothetical protein
MILYYKNNYDDSEKYKRRYLFFLNTGMMIFLNKDIKSQFVDNDSPEVSSTEVTSKNIYQLMAYRLGEGDSFKASLNKELVKNSLLLFEEKDDCKKINKIFDLILEKNKIDNEIIELNQDES